MICEFIFDGEDMVRTAICLQAAVRAYTARKQFQSDKTSIVLLQSIWKARQARVAFLNSRALATTSQSAIRGYPVLLIACKCIIFH